MLNVRSYLFLLLVPALALSACGGDKTVDSTTGAVQEAIPREGSHLAGTYTANTRKTGDFTQLVLKTDGTYHARMVAACIAPNCRDIEQDGRFALFRRETLTYFQTYDAAGAVNGRYEYRLENDALLVRKLGVTDTFLQMLRAPTAWCAVNQDCALQDLQIGPCAGQYICTTANFCNWQCGAAPEIAGKNQKSGNGG